MQPSEIEFGIGGRIRFLGRPDSISRQQVLVARSDHVKLLHLSWHFNDGQKKHIFYKIFVVTKQPCPISIVMRYLCKVFPLEALPSFKVNWVCWIEFERVCMFLIFNHWDIEVILERISLLEIELSSLTYYLMQIVPTISFSNDAIERMKIWKSDIFKSHSEVSDLDKMETDEWWLDKARQSWADWFFVEEFSWINWKIQWPHHPYQYW